MSDLPFDVDEPEQPTLASTVLVVDDEAVVAILMVRLLQREPDLVVLTADTAEAGLALVKDRHVDLLVVDKNLPGMGGIEMISEAKKARPGLEAVLITGYASAGSVLAAMAAGASDYLAKPFENLAVVRARLRSALERRAARIAARQRAKALAREASDLLARGQTVPDEVWGRLESQLSAYESAITEGGEDVVQVIGPEPLVEALTAEGIDARRCAPSDVTALPPSVVVLDTSAPDWRTVADALADKAHDVVLVAREDADLADLLDAISLRMDLVGFGGTKAAMLPSRVRALLMRRAVEKAREGLAQALAQFRAALGRG